MADLTSAAVDAAIGRVTAGLPAFRLPPDLLSRFSGSARDLAYREYLTSREPGDFRFLPLLVKQLGLRTI